MVKDILSAHMRLRGVVKHTPTEFNETYSTEKRRVFFKREDTQLTRSYKLRGAFNLISLLTDTEKANGVVCASAGNHAQGVAYACKNLGVKGTIFMPRTTPQQKVQQTKRHGNSEIEIRLMHDTFDEVCKEAVAYAEQEGRVFVHPFNDERVIAGQGTVAVELLQDIIPDYVIVPVGGGGLIAGVSRYIKEVFPNTKVIGVEPFGAPSMTRSLEAGKVVALETIDKFVDGAAVKKVGEIPFDSVRKYVDDMLLVHEGAVSQAVLDLYSKEGMVVEPAGALSVAALDQLDLKGKVVCIISGGNNDFTRLNEMEERSLLYKGLRHYFVVQFPQRAGALKEFVNSILGPNDDIIRFEYQEKNRKETGPVRIGVEVQKVSDYESLVGRMNVASYNFQEITGSDLFSILF
jgi:threonine dehydratase